MPKEVKKYQCNYCKKCWVSKSKAVNHELECFHNPETRSCSSCTWHSSAEGYCRWCEYLDKEIFIKGSPVRHCETWKNKYEHEVEE